MHTIAEDLKIALSIKNLQEQNQQLKDYSKRYCPQFDVVYYEEEKFIRVAMQLDGQIFTYDLEESVIEYHDPATLAQIAGGELSEAFRSKIVPDIIEKVLKAVRNKKIIDSKVGL